MRAFRTRTGYALPADRDDDAHAPSLIASMREVPTKRLFAAGLPAHDTHVAKRLGEVVVESLIDEVTLAPKPGLVDVRGNGAHRDLS